MSQALHLRHNVTTAAQLALNPHRAVAERRREREEACYKTTGVTAFLYGGGKDELMAVRFALSEKGVSLEPYHVYFSYVEVIKGVGAEGEVVEDEEDRLGLGLEEDTEEDSEEEDSEEEPVQRYLRMVSSSLPNAVPVVRLATAHFGSDHLVKCEDMATVRAFVAELLHVLMAFVGRSFALERAKNVCEVVGNEAVSMAKVTMGGVTVLLEFADGWYPVKVKGGDDRIREVFRRRVLDEAVEVVLQWQKEEQEESIQESTQEGTACASNH